MKPYRKSKVGVWMKTGASQFCTVTIQISLTPCFSGVLSETKLLNRFSGFQAPAATVREHGGSENR